MRLIFEEAERCRKGGEKKSVKEEVIDMLRRLPDDITLEDIQYHLYVRQLVEEGIRDVEAGRVIPHEEVVRQMDEWLRPRRLHRS